MINHRCVHCYSISYPPVALLLTSGFLFNIYNTGLASTFQHHFWSLWSATRYHPWPRHLRLHAHCWLQSFEEVVRKHFYRNKIERDGPFLPSPFQEMYQLITVWPWRTPASQNIQKIKDKMLNKSLLSSQFSFFSAYEQSKAKAVSHVANSTHC